jgi:predicted DNA-binding transcriptional regulator YafY
VNADAVIAIKEGALGRDRKLTVQRDGRYLVEATVVHTYALRVWILGFAEGMEVLEPTELRDEIARKLTEAAARYKTVAKKRPVQRKVKR